MAAIAAKAPRARNRRSVRFTGPLISCRVAGPCARRGRLLLPLQGRVVLREDLREVVEGRLARRLLVEALDAEIARDDDLRPVSHRDVGVSVLRALRGSLEDFQSEAEGRVHRHVPHLLLLPAVGSADLRADLHRIALLLEDMPAQDRLRWG